MGSREVDPVVFGVARTIGSFPENLAGITLRSGDAGFGRGADADVTRRRFCR
jgi:hypothetical protein